MSDPKGDRSLANVDIRLFETGNLADATIVCGDRTWNVHKVIGSSRCKWFETAFYGKFAEAASGKVVLEEQDPDLIDNLLRYIYAKDINIPKLKDGEHIPALCVRIFRLGDFFLIHELKVKAMAELTAYIDTELEDLDTDTDGESPGWLTEVLDALEEAYKDISTEPVLGVLLKFFRANKRQIFMLKDAIALLDKIPEMAGDLMKSCLVGGDMAEEPRTFKFRVGLPVFMALHSSDILFEYETEELGPAGLDELPCLLYPSMDSSRWPFKVVNPVTEQEIGSLSWIAPLAIWVKMITSHGLSKIVRVDMSRCRRRKLWLYIRFGHCDDAKAFVEGYCRANPRIKSVAGGTATSMSAAMRLRVARVSDTSPWLGQHVFEDSNLD
ncbi:hypothetical protein LA080_008847 [Diaporthe eres]|uniref:BTB domain-containing protein n=1 Tax=Diaporthe vaccinii TaxID=105482 RepID=A0ABR4E596_9PEZI|nr:hypothetical protein LA080_008847 [Diaporthe eres]